MSEGGAHTHIPVLHPVKVLGWINVYDDDALQYTFSRCNITLLMSHQNDVKFMVQSKCFLVKCQIIINETYVNMFANESSDSGLIFCGGAPSLVYPLVECNLRYGLHSRTFQDCSSHKYVGAEVPSKWVTLLSFSSDVWSVSAMRQKCVLQCFFFFPFWGGIFLDGSLKSTRQITHSRGGSPCETLCIILFFPLVADDH